MIVGIAVQLLMIGYMQSITGDKPDSLWTAYCLVLFGTLVASVKSILLTRKGLDFKTALPLMDKYDALDKQCMEDLKAFISGNRNPAACEDAVTNWAQHEARLASEATATPSEA
ncbi:hypothetical protein TH5_00350 [Thalassospira xianhensis MCCC 1A02616]|nr:hypothetical protein TH5_00350 [Thalassospira xianhensis MCCC 1A02616]